MHECKKMVGIAILPPRFITGIIISSSHTGKIRFHAFETTFLIIVAAFSLPILDIIGIKGGITYDLIGEFLNRQFGIRIAELIVRPDGGPGTDAGFFHAEFRRANPFGGWGHEIRVNSPEANIANKGKPAWDNNYVILQTSGKGHYLGCNISVTNFQGTWWGEGDDMIWVDGYKWPPDLHGTGSEDYLNQAWGMQTNAFLRNGSSIHESNTNGYQTSYVLHIENPVRFEKEIKVTIEHGHGNHLANEMSSVAYWYADRPAAAIAPPPVAKRLPILRDNQGRWLYDKKGQCPGKQIAPNAEMKRMKARWAKKHA